jgi:hypothetical protein
MMNLKNEIEMRRRRNKKYNEILNKRAEKMAKRLIIQEVKKKGYDYDLEIMIPAIKTVKPMCKIAIKFIERDYIKRFKDEYRRGWEAAHNR